MSYKIAKFAEIRISPQNADRLPHGNRAALVLLSHIANDLNVMKRLIILMSRSPCDEIALRIWRAQSEAITLMAGAKCREALRSLWETLPNLELVADGVDDVERFKDEVDRLFKSDRFPLLKSLRDKVASHYDFKLAQRLTANMTGNEGTLVFYPERRTGNSFYPAGDRLLNGAAAPHLGDLTASNSSEFQEDYFRWHDDVFHLVDGVLHALILDATERLGTRSTDVVGFIDDDFVFDGTETALPLFLA